MNLIPITKTVVKTVVGSSVAFTVANVLINNTTPQTKLQTAEALVGSAVVGYMAAEYCDNWTDAKIDAAAAWWNENIKKSTDK